MNNHVELLLASLQTVPEEYFEKRYNRDESIYLYVDKVWHRIDRKEQVFINKKTNKQCTFELGDDKIYPTKAKTIEKIEEEINRMKEALKKAR